MSRVLPFDHPDALLPHLTGGKGANLSRLTRAGFPVPAGFVITTEVYDEVIGAGDIAPRIEALVDEIDYDDPDTLESKTAELRGTIVTVELSESIALAITDAYALLGEDIYVAVRSSGTAEDLADASFAGQYETYLDVRGADAVVDAVKRCWASMWTARATKYRRQRGFAHGEVQVAVVVQAMVESEVAGVMFTGNPVTTATDETVINATWGLGEALVQGMITPDEFIVQVPDLTLLEQTIGTKELRIVRDHAAGRGVVTEVVDEVDRMRPSLEIGTVIELARLGERIRACYRGIPQDIEWGYADGQLQLLQARPITGVDFSWAADVEAGNDQPVAPDVVWTRAFADAVTTGVVCPLTYSVRYPMCSSRMFRRIWHVLGREDGAEMRQFKYWKGEVYYNVESERMFVELLVPPQLRPAFLDFIPPSMHEKVLTAPFDEGAFVRGLWRWFSIDNDTTPTRFPQVIEQWRQRTDIDGLTIEELRGLDDEPLIAYTQAMVDLEGDWGEMIYPPFTYTLRLLMGALGWMLASWYDGDPAMTLGKLLAGLPRETDTQREQAALHALASRIAASPALSEALEQFTDGAFFAQLETSDEGRRFLDGYAQFLQAWGHRGHADRDMYYPRRSEDPGLDYRAFKLIINGGQAFDPERERRDMTRAREAALAEVTGAVGLTERGAVKVELLKAVYTMLHEHLMIRDNERGRPTDTIMMSYKRGFVEIGRRCFERNQIAEARDFHFLSDIELYRLLRGQTPDEQLLRVKIAARARDCDRVLRKEHDHPKYMVRGRAVDLDHAAEQRGDGIYRGTPTAPGLKTGTARVLHDHSEMGRVSPGEILVTHATDPGWNPVFNLISAVVIETGGMLAHAACLAREYGFPAVSLPGATRMIADGAAITVDGHSGTVVLVASESEAVVAEPIGAHH